MLDRLTLEFEPPPFFDVVLFLRLLDLSLLFLISADFEIIVSSQKETYCCFDVNRTLIFLRDTGHAELLNGIMSNMQYLLLTEVETCVQGKSRSRLVRVSNFLIWGGIIISMLGFQIESRRTVNTGKNVNGHFDSVSLFNQHLSISGDVVSMFLYLGPLLSFFGVALLFSFTSEVTDTERKTDINRIGVIVRQDDVRQGKTMPKSRNIDF